MSKSRFFTILSFSVGVLGATYLLLLVSTVLFATTATENKRAQNVLSTEIAILETSYFGAVGALHDFVPEEHGFFVPDTVVYLKGAGDTVALSSNP